MLLMLRRRRAAYRLRRSTQSQGQALVEFAVVSILMIMILATVADFGRLFYAQITVENAARAGAMVAARAPDSYTGACPAATATNKIGCAIVAESRGSGTTFSPAEISVTCVDFAGTAVSCGSTPEIDKRSKVTISKTFGFIMPVLTAIIGNSITMSASAAADQESLPPASTFAPPTPTPTATATATPTATPTTAPTGTPTTAPTATPTTAPTATPAPCTTGYAPVPDLVVGATPGSPETVAEARAEWLTAGFTANNFAPSNGLGTKTVVTQIPSDVGYCKSVTTYAVTVTYR